jgi:hypothetical protein
MTQDKPINKNNPAPLRFIIIIFLFVACSHRCQNPKEGPIKFCRCLVPFSRAALNIPLLFTSPSNQIAPAREMQKLKKNQPIQFSFFYSKYNE